TASFFLNTNPYFHPSLLVLSLVLYLPNINFDCALSQLTRAFLLFHWPCLFQRTIAISTALHCPIHYTARLLHSRPRSIRCLRADLSTNTTYLYHYHYHCFFYLYLYLCHQHHYYRFSSSFR
ncbi:hypothetical protein BDF19DRAFT_464310, partial [Syncephalis fuscata]